MRGIQKELTHEETLHVRVRPPLERPERGGGITGALVTDGDEDNILDGKIGGDLDDKRANDDVTPDSSFVAPACTDAGVGMVGVR